MSLAIPIISPEEVSSLFGNWDVSKLTGLVNGNTIENIIDSVNGNHLTQPTSGNRFTYQTNQFNGYPSALKNISRNGQLYYGINNNIENIWSGDLTLFMCVRLPSLITPNVLLASGVFNFGSTGGFELIISGNQIFYRELLNVQTFISQGINQNINQLQIVTVNIKRSGQSYLRVNDKRTLMSSNTPAYNQSIYDNIYLMCSPISSAGTLLPSYFSQMVIYNRSLSLQEEVRVYRGLKFKWGVN